MKAVHFGAGNIGRGFVGLLLSNAGYELVFADVADALIEGLKQSDSYSVHEVGDDPRTTVVRGYTALNSAKETEALVAAIASADVVTAAACMVLAAGCLPRQPPLLWLRPQAHRPDRRSADKRRPAERP